MPTKAERIRQVQLKIDRAKRHFEELDAECGNYLKSRPMEIGHRHREGDRRLVYFVQRVRPIPDAISLALGDGIQNLVTALDHLAYQLVCAGSGDNPPQPRDIYFPISGSAEAYEGSKGRKLNGASAEAIAKIDELRPYRNGHSSLWLLQQLNNTEKHRLLLTVAFELHSVDLGGLIKKLIVSKFPEPRDERGADMAKALSGFKFFVKPEIRGPLVEGFELLMGMPDEQPQGTQELRVQISLAEKECPQDKTVGALCKTFGDDVQKVVDDLTPLFE